MVYCILFSNDYSLHYSMVDDQLTIFQDNGKFGLPPTPLKGFISVALCFRRKPSLRRQLFILLFELIRFELDTVYHPLNNLEWKDARVVWNDEENA